MKSICTILFISLFFTAFSQTGNFDYLTTNRRFTIAGRAVKGISNDSIWLIASADSLVTQYAVKGYVDNHFGPGTSNAYNFNPEQFIVSGYDVSIRFPQDPGEPLFSNSASFNFTQRHLNFLDSLMLAVGEDTYLDDRDFYYSPDSLHPIRTKSFTLSTDGTGAASWDSVNKRLNIPVSSSGGGGSSSPYHLPYNGNANYYLAGDSGLHPLPVTDTSSLSSRIDSKLNTSDTTGKWLPIGTFIPAAYVGDSIDYSFTSMTTIYNEAGPGEYTISSSDLSFNKDNLQNPFRQLKALDVGGWNNGSYVSFKNTGNVNSTAYTFLRGFVRLKQTVPIIQSLSFRFYNAGVPVSQIVSMVNYGLDKSKINTYQNITIPMSAFQFSSNTFDEVRLIFGGGSSPDGLYLDLFQFQNATVNENIYVTDVFRVPGSTQVKKILGGQTVDAYTDSVGTGSTVGTITWLGTTYNINTGNNITLPTPTTTNVTEGTNLYYTNARARAAISVTGSGSYDNTTGVINIGATSQSPYFVYRNHSSLSNIPSWGYTDSLEFGGVFKDQVADAMKRFQNGWTMPFSDDLNGMGKDIGTTIYFTNRTSGAGLRAGSGATGNSRIMANVDGSTYILGSKNGIGGSSPTSTSHLFGSVATSISTKTVQYILTINDNTILADASAGAYNVTLPTAVGISGREYLIKKIDASSNAVTLITTSSQAIDTNSTNYILSTQNKYVRVKSDGANWFIIGNN